MRGTGRSPETQQPQAGSTQPKGLGLQLPLGWAPKGLGELNSTKDLNSFLIPLMPLAYEANR